MISTVALEEKLRDRAVARMVEAGDELRRRIEHDAPRDTGALSVAPVTVTTSTERQVVTKITVDRKSASGFDVATAQEEGTGVYAGRGRIYPIPPNRRLVFFWPKIGAVVSFASVKGTPATHFFSTNVDRWLDDLREAFGQ